MRTRVAIAGGPFGERRSVAAQGPILAVEQPPRGDAWADGAHGSSDEAQDCLGAIPASEDVAPGDPDEDGP